VKNQTTKKYSAVDKPMYVFSLPVFEDKEVIEDRDWRILEEWVIMMYEDRFDLTMLMLARA